MIQTILFFSVISFFITAISLIPIINWAKKNNLTDAPGGRKVHKQPIPVLGGVGIFVGMAVSLFFAKSQFDFSELIFPGVALAALFVVGLFDDLKNLNAKFRMLFQLSLAAGLYFARFKMTGLYGLFGIEELPTYINFILTILTITAIINAYNLIDGVNGLAGSLGFLGAVAFGSVFLYFGELTFSVIAFIFAGSLLGFLKHNFGKAKVFLGDNGSTVLGLMMSLFFIKLINLKSGGVSDYSLLPLGLSIISVPIFDLFRVFIYRLSAGRSFFAADKSHFHHLFLKIGKSHSWIAVFLTTTVALNILFTVATLGQYSVFMSLFIPTLFMFGLVVLARLSKSLTTLKSSEFTRHQMGYHYN